MLGTIAYQRLHAADVPGGPWLWLVLLDVVPPLLALAIALRPTVGARVTRTYAMALGLTGSIWTWHPPQQLGAASAARGLTSVATATGAIQMWLATRVLRDGRHQPAREIDT